MNPWPVYSEMKRHFHDTNKRLTEQEVRWRVPGATEAEIKEGMIEFDLAYEHDLKYQMLPFEPTAEELNDPDVIPFPANRRSQSRDWA